MKFFPIEKIAPFAKSLSPMFSKVLVNKVDTQSIYTNNFFASSNFIVSGMMPLRT